MDIHRPRVLVVDAEAPVLARQLGSAYEAVPCTSAEVALQAAEVAAPAAVIAEILLASGADGIDVVQHLRARAGRIPALLVTAASTLPVSYLARVKELGSAIEFAPKPVSGAQLQRFLDHATILHALDIADAAELASVVDDVATRAKLKATDRLLLALVARGMKRRQIALRLDARPDTLHSRIRRLLERAGQVLHGDYKDTRELREKLLELAKGPASTPGADLVPAPVVTNRVAAPLST